MLCSKVKILFVVLNKRNFTIRSVVELSIKPKKSIVILRPRTRIRIPQSEKHSGFGRVGFVH